MQFFILLIGILLFTFYQFHPSPLLFNQVPVNQALSTTYADSIRMLQQQHESLAAEKHHWAMETTKALDRGEAAETAVENLQQVNLQQERLRKEAKRLITASGVSDVNDTNYIFLRFVVDQLPAGIVGLLIAIIFLAAWGSIAAALNALASASVVDFHKKFIQKDLSDEEDYRVSRLYSLFWGVFCVVTAMFVTGMGSLIEAVNVLGSWFYGVILGIFLVAFYLPYVRGGIVFWSALVAQVLVILTYLFIPIGWLWLNVVGVFLVIALSLLLTLMKRYVLK